MKFRNLVESLTGDPLWICRAKSNYRRLRCRAPVLFRRLRSASPPSRRKSRPY